MNSLHRYKINGSKIIHQTIDGEVVIINLDSGNYYSLNKVGADIWSCIERSAVMGEIVEEIIHRHNGSRTDVESAVTQLLAELQQEDLVVLDHVKEPGSIKGPDAPVETGPQAEVLSFQAPTLQKYTDMQDFILLDPIHEVDETGWPARKPDTPS